MGAKAIKLGSLDKHLGIHLDIVVATVTQGTKRTKCKCKCFEKNEVKY